MTEMTEETKTIKLGDHPFFADLTHQALTFQDFTIDHEITVMAVAGRYGDWAAYFESPQFMGRIREYGSKMPEQVAADLFPEWAKRLKWRP